MPSPGSAVTPQAPSRLPLPSARWRRPAAAGLAVVLLGGLAACGGDDEPTTQPSPSPTSAPTSASPSASPTPSASGSSSPSESAPTSASPSETASSPAGGALAEALLTADEVPGLNDASSWTEAGTSPVGEQPFGWCARTGALVVGAQEGVQRDFTSGDDTTSQQVLDVVDQTNARRLEQVVRGWHRDCRGQGTRVGPIRPVPGSSGTAWWYLSSRSAGDGTWEAFAFAREGGRVTLLRMEHTGQDHSYPTGQDPLERAAAVAADRLA